MGVEYIRFLIPKKNEIRFEPEQIFALADAFKNNDWIPREDFVYEWTIEGKTEWSEEVTASWMKEKSGKNMLLSWPVDLKFVKSVKYPFEEVSADAYYEIQLHMSPFYVYRMAEQIDPFKSTDCKCGTELELWPDDSPFFSAAILPFCPDCGAEYKVSEQAAKVRTGLDLKEGTVYGGATSRFAVAVDCGKCIPPGDTEPPFTSEFCELVEKALGEPFYEIGYYY